MLTILVALILISLVLPIPTLPFFSYLIFMVHYFIFIFFIFCIFVFLIYLWMMLYWVFFHSGVSVKMFFMWSIYNSTMPFLFCDIMIMNTAIAWGNYFCHSLNIRRWLFLKKKNQEIFKQLAYKLICMKYVLIIWLSGSFGFLNLSKRKSSEYYI